MSRRGTPSGAGCARPGQRERRALRAGGARSRTCRAEHGARRRPARSGGRSRERSASSRRPRRPRPCARRGSPGRRNGGNPPRGRGATSRCPRCRRRAPGRRRRPSRAPCAGRASPPRRRGRSRRPCRSCRRHARGSRAGARCSRSTGRTLPPRTRSGRAARRRGSWARAPPHPAVGKPRRAEVRGSAGSTSVSLLRTSTWSAPWARACRIPMSLPSAKPRFAGFSISSIAGNSRRTASEVPSVEALSTTITCGAGSAAASDRRHASVSSRRFQERTTAATRPST